MLHDQEALVRGVQIHRRINDLSKLWADRSMPQQTVVLSQELYFALLEYTVLMNESAVNRDLLLWELFHRDELFFDTGEFQLRVRVDFFLPPDTITIC